MPNVELQIGGMAYGGWESMRLQIGMEQLAGTFELQTFDRWPEQFVERPIRPGQSCRITVDGEVVITGWVDEVQPELSGTSHTVKVTGRDMTGDLVDCSVLHKGGQWTNRTLAQIATDVCAPFGITVIAQVPTPIIKSARIQQGETAYELLSRLAVQVGVLLMTDGAGHLVIAKAGTTTVSTVLQEGVNLLSSKLKSSWKERYSKYIVTGQTPAPRDEDDATSAAQPIPAVEPDPELVAAGRYRPLVVVSVTHGVPMANHAAWECRVRIGRSTRATVAVVGWSHATGLWRPNTLVRLVAPYLQINEPLMIASVTFSLDEKGMTTELELADPRAFDALSHIRSTGLDKSITGKDGLQVRKRGDRAKARLAGAEENS